MISSRAILSAYFLVWAAVHSLLASLRVKNWVLAKLGAGVDRWYRLAYVAFAMATSLPVFAMGALLPDRGLYVVPTPWRWLMIGGPTRSGARTRWPGRRGRSCKPAPPISWGCPSCWPGDRPTTRCRYGAFYCYVRHPLYLFAILFVWLTPAMTVNMATLYGLITLYFVVGSVHEEGRLVAEFGAAYRAYQRQVPRLIPRPGQCYATAGGMAAGNDTGGRA